MKRLSICFALAVAMAAPAMAQGQMAPKPMAGANPLTNSLKGYYDNVKDWVTKSAALMAEKDYSFHPATMPAPDKAEIRTFGAIIGHVAQENYLFCGTASGMAAPAGSDTIEKSKTMKADLQKALADSFAFCDRAWAATNDKNAATPMDLPFNLGKNTRLGTLSFNTTHDAEHYGNLVTYLRAKGLVPPSSAPAGK
jgi:uncharacterized damage-inducible protein DinB